MTERAPIRIDDATEVAIGLLAEGRKDVEELLGNVTRQPEPLNIVLDIVDMNIRGDQIGAAWIWAKRDMAAFVEALALRDTAMVVYINSVVPKPDDEKARVHGAQKRISQVDFAVESALQAQKLDGITERIDEGAEHIHNFFLTTLRAMQASNEYIAFMTVNLGIESGHSARFSIQLVELLDMDGNPMKSQPQDEGKRVAEAQAAADFQPHPVANDIPFPTAEEWKRATKNKADEQFAVPKSTHSAISYEEIQQQIADGFYKEDP